MSVYQLFVKPMVLFGLAVSLSSAMEPTEKRTCPALTARDVVHLIKGGFVTHGNMKFVMAKGDQERLPKLFNMEILLNAESSEIPNISMFTTNETKIIDLKRDNENYRCQYRGDLSSDLFQNNPEKIHLQIVQFKGKEWLVDEKNPDKKRSPDEEEAYKMWLMNQLGELPKDITNIIGGNLLEMGRNPVLEGKVSLMNYDYTYHRVADPNPIKTMSIKDLLQPDGSLDLGKLGKIRDGQKLIVTTNPDHFFQSNKKEKSSGFYKILIAPKYLIAEKLSTTTKPFEVIMDEWDADKNPIGIFVKAFNNTNFDYYSYVTDKSINELSSQDLYNIFREAKKFPNKSYYDEIQGVISVTLKMLIFDFR